MATFEEIISAFRIQRIELTAWIEHQWVRPRETAAGPEFDDVDQARIALICDLREAFSCNEETLEIVLSLLDQVYVARRTLRTLQEAMSELPSSVQDQIRARLRGR